MSEESFKIYSGKKCEEYYKKYNLVSAVHKIIDLEDIIKEVREKIEDEIERATNSIYIELDEDTYIKMFKKYLQILDKGNKE